MKETYEDFTVLKGPASITNQVKINNNVSSSNLQLSNIQKYFH